MAVKACGEVTAIFKDIVDSFGDNQVTSSCVKTSPTPHYSNQPPH